MRFTATEIARAVGGIVAGTGEDVEVDGATIDSREIRDGQLFVPIVATYQGGRDGHEFIAAAVTAGASAYLTSNAPVARGATAIAVNDTGRALRALGQHARSLLDAPVVGITGSVGKTTVKDLTAAALATHFAVHASPRSFNNELGVPITLANSPEGVDVVVVEMGARGRGHIADLCEIARPTIGIVTTVVLAHAEMFGTIEEVAAEKGELVEALPPSGTAVLNGDQPLVAAMAARTGAKVVSFGVERAGVDVTASAISIDDELRASFRLHSPWGEADMRLSVRGAHQVMNALAAAAGAFACGVPLENVVAGLARATSSAWRMDLRRAASGALVLNDAYNANPTSMEAALRSLASLPARRRIAVVGVMAELGPSGPAEHRRMAELAGDLGIALIAVDAPDYGVDLVIGLEEALDALGAIGKGDAVLVKGSRVVGLEQLAARLLA